MNESRLSEAEAARLEQQMAQTQDVRVYRRMRALLDWGRGQSVSQIAVRLKVSRQSVYNWIERYSHSHEPASLADEDRPGRPCQWTEESESLLQELLVMPPTEFGHQAVNWTVPLLQHQVATEIGQRFSEDTVRRALRRLGYTWKQYRYALAPDPELEKKTRDSGAN